MLADVAGQFNGAFGSPTWLRSVMGSQAPASPLEATRPRRRSLSTCDSDAANNDVAC